MAQLPEPGSTFAEKYVIESELGRGAAGVVFAAMHTGLKQLVAIKILREAGEVAVERMAREARAAVSLQSEHVVRVMDVGSDGGHVYSVSGRSSTAWTSARSSGSAGSCPSPRGSTTCCRRAPGSPRRTRRGVVHRDPKPGNLSFSPRRSDGGPLGEGARLRHLEGRALRQRRRVAHRGCGMLGSPMYMAPEQVRGARNADPRADVWSLGVVLFRLITRQGRLGAPASVSAALASVVADEPTRLRELVPGAPRELEQVVLACMNKDPDARVSSVVELAARFAPFGTDDGRVAVARLLRGSPGSGARRARARRWPLLVAVAVALVGVPAAALGAARHERDREPGGLRGAASGRARAGERRQPATASAVASVASNT